MQLQSLEISGFKSFGKKAKLSFDAPITAIVGPNGSGKSNVAEAFRFVLGEQSIKSMRGKKGEDLIFNGQIGSGRQNKASVIVTLDNHDRTLSIDYDTVTIERVVHRDGVNEYFINGSVVRLKDIVELLAGANIGSTGHHIISQGEADRILNTTPKERRAMLEDALGLKTYQYKKIESEKKLVKTEENIAQVESLRKEIQPHIKFLKKQVEKIEQARVFQEQLSQLYAEYLKRETVTIAYHEQRIATAITAPTQQLESIQRDIATYQAELAQSTHVDTRTDALIALENELRTVRDTKNARSREIGQLEGEISSMQKMQERERRAQHDVMVRLQDVEALHGDMHAKITQAEQVYDVVMLKQILVAITQLFQQFITERRSHAPTSDESLAQEIERITQKRAEVLMQLQSISEQETALLERIGVARKTIEDSKTDMLEAERKLFELQTKKSEIENTLNRLRMEQEVVFRRREECNREIQEAVVLIGREAHGYESFVVDESQVVTEDATVQQERRRTLEKLKIRIEELGTGSSHEVMKEFEEVTERDAFLVREIQDLETSAVSLRQLITDLDEEINRRFRTGVQLINEQFQHFFALMFGGGEAGLRLVVPEIRRKKKDTDISFDADEPTEEEQAQEEGVDIHISLPRKKVKGLMMLSGGERALTSIALIFAMSAVNPPPFIILDETDAALDEANAKKYADMVEHLAGQSQLILITHNRETMSRASTIYGVTMMQGISELLSIKFDQGVQYAK